MDSHKPLLFKTFVMILIMIIAGPLGNVLLGKGMQSIERRPIASFPDLVHVVRRILTSGAVWLGVASLLTFFVANILVLSWADYSFVQPASSMAYGVVALLSVFILGESVSPLRWTGIAIICAGCLHRWPHPPAHYGAPLTMFKFIYFFMIVVAGTAGELCVSRAMKQTGEVKDFRPAAIVRVILRALRNKVDVDGRRHDDAGVLLLAGGTVVRKSQLRGSGHRVKLCGGSAGRQVLPRRANQHITAGPESR